MEFIGANGPTRRLQDVTVRAFETTQVLGQLEFRDEKVNNYCFGMDNIYTR